MAELIVVGCGSRRTTKVVHLRDEVGRMLADGAPRYVIEGGADGGDRVWRDAAQDQGIQVIECPVSRT